MKGINVGHRMLIKCNDQIPFSQGSAICRAVRLNRNYEDRRLLAQLMKPHDSAMHRHILTSNSNILFIPNGLSCPKLISSSTSLSS